MSQMDELVRRRLIADFPGLATTDFRVTSPKTQEYNCIAWGARDSGNWWEPDPLELYYWPVLDRKYTLESFMAAYESVGFLPCSGGTFEDGFEKLALFVDQAGVPTHAARQLPDGRWTSKLGLLEDIEHELHALAGRDYGVVKAFMRRPCD